MFIRILKECQCKLSFCYDRHAYDQHKDDDWVRGEKQQDLKLGDIIKAVRVRPSNTQQDCCNIEKSIGEEANVYLNVPWNCIEITDEDPEQAESP